MSEIIFYRSKCIGCGICCIMLPALWMMSKKDGKASLRNATVKKGVAVLSVSKLMEKKFLKLSRACPVKIIEAL